MEPILEVKDLKTYFITKDSTAKAVDGVSFSVMPGETFGLVGESGCGKSATCRSILQLIHKPGRTVGGEVIYKGQNILDMPPAELRKIRGSEIGMIFQEPMTSLNPVLKIKEQIFENLKDKNLTKQQKHDRAIELLKLVGIPTPETRLDEYIHQYSGGMRQRAMIAIALAAEPKVLLADEPTTALDVTIQDQIIKLLGKLKTQLGMSIILITHDLGVVAQMCDYVAVMYAGHIVEKADTNTLLTAPRHPYTYGLIRSIPTGLEGSKKLESIEGMPPDLNNMPEGCPFAPRCKFKGELCTKVRPEMRKLGNGHEVACHYTEKLEGVSGLQSSEKKV
ncbi:oligopeptide/dipeptide ABC transporter ATP-binding protein [Lawsonibacter celer]|uniref:oligopeptide/dipeptide ABC transporter ATP-binding protein n=1 Tax=Lawsonibacter celer TaxID=2986526 RepID=UPI001647EDDA